MVRLIEVDWGDGTGARAAIDLVGDVNVCAEFGLSEPRRDVRHRVVETGLALSGI
jgi:hypothetical protein